MGEMAGRLDMSGNAGGEPRDAESDGPRDVAAWMDAAAAGGAGDDPGEHGPPGAAEGELWCGGVRWPLRGRALRLILWLATRQGRINEVASESGQLWITWKGNGPRSIDGEVKTRLSGE